MTNRLVHNSTYGYRAMLEWLSLQSPIVVYIFLIFNAMVESIFPPYPSDAFVAVIAFSAGQGHFDVYAVYGTTCLGSIAGIMIVYTIGRYWGDMVVQVVSRSFLRKIMPLAMIERAKRKFIRHDDIIIVLNRFLPGMRAALCFAAGIARVEARKMFFYSFVSVCAWNLFLVMISYHIGSSWDQASAFLRNYNIAIALILIVLVVVVSFVYSKKRKGI